MHRTRTPLRKWFWAICLVSSDKRGLSALQLSQKLKVGCYVAWTMLDKVSARPWPTETGSELTAWPHFRKWVG